MRKPATISFILIILIIITIATASALEWSEILFNPLGNDNNKEFVELVGNENLDGCIVRDSASSDKMTLLHPGTNGIILILENDSIYHNESAILDSTVYVIGAAIGNGLGNTNETLSISCNRSGDVTLLLNTSYVVADIADFAEGQSIIYQNGSWALGPMNGTPGVPDFSPQGNDTQENSTNTTNTTAPAPPPSDGGPALCNESMMLFVPTKILTNSSVRITLFSPEYASFDVFDTGTSNTTPIAAGDNLRGNAHVFTAPSGATKLKVVAYGRVCGASSRMTRYIIVTGRPNINFTDDTTLNASQDNASSENMTSENMSLRSMDEKIGISYNILATGAALMENDTAQNGSGDAGTPGSNDITPNKTYSDASAIVGTTVLDQNADAVPWIAAFGIVTLLVSAGVFLSVLRSERRKDERLKEAVDAAGTPDATRGPSGTPASAPRRAGNGRGTTGNSRGRRAGRRWWRGAS